MTLTGFLLARIAEDVAEDKRIDETPPGSVYDVDVSIIHPICDRVLAECEAKREIIGLIDAEWEAYAELDVLGEWNLSRRDALEQILFRLAAPYAGHPDYDEAWRPTT